MKYTKFVFILLIFILIFCSSCNVKRDEMPSVKFIIYTNSEQLKAYELTIDSGNIAISPEPLFTYDKGDLSIDDMLPIQYEPEQVVLKTVPTSISTSHYRIDNSKGKAIYYKDYYIQKSEDGWALFEKNRNLGKINLIYNDCSLNPVSFSIVDNKLVLLCVSLEYIENIDVVTVTYDIDDNLETIINPICYVDIWDEYQISQIDCPTTHNTVATENGFLYNEGRRIFFISNKKNEITEIIDETNAISYIPYFDSQRESYAFFNKCGIQNNIYVVSFSAYNNQPSMYVELFSSNNKLLYYVLVTDEAIYLYDEKSNIIDTVTGEFMTYVTIS